MRKFLAIVFVAGAFLRGILDWTATVSQGEAWKFAGIGTLMERNFPDAFLSVQSLMAATLSHKALAFYAHNIHPIPLIAILLFLGGFFWLISGPTKRNQARMVFSRS